MAKGIVIYYSRSGNTQEMGEIIAKAMNASGLSTECKSVDRVRPDDLTGYDAIVIGAPCYYGQMAAPVKHLIDELVSRHGQLNGKIGAAFSSSANIGGGSETTVLGIIEAMLIAGMVVQGDPQGAHYGPLSIGKPDDKVRQQCERRGQRVAALTQRLFA
ncbi:MAG: flavodoxin family protein [Planctomycetes bacterium]|jgi:NAD(P)H dehydrogenase (quinone)|nr:flavodoxin family protein [Planctomycetota bacterium]